LNDYSLRQLRQRITVRYHLNPLTKAEVGRYIQHRLQTAGANGSPFFTGPGLWRMYRYTKGIPRLVNALSDKCLLAAFVQQSDRIDYRIVGRAIRELEGDINV
jgi:general secretion pathway protein A